MGNGKSGVVGGHNIHLRLGRSHHQRALWRHGKNTRHRALEIALNFERNIGALCVPSDFPPPNQCAVFGCALRRFVTNTIRPNPIRIAAPAYGKSGNPSR